MSYKFQAFKMSLAVFLCIIVSDIFNLKYPFFLALPALIPIKDNFQTITLGRNRIIGSIIGGIVGIGLSYIKRGDAVLSGLGILIIFYLNKLIKLSNTTAIATLMFISIFVGFMNETPISFSWIRLLDTFVGILIAFLVNNVLFRVNPNKYLFKMCENAYDKNLFILKNIICDKRKVNVEGLEKKVEVIKIHFKNYKDEFKFEFEKYKRISAENLIPIIYQIFDHTKVINQMYNGKLNEDNCIKINKLFSCEETLHENLSEIDIVYNYHVKIVLENINLYQQHAIDK